MPVQPFYGCFELLMGNKFVSAFVILHIWIFHFKVLGSFIQILVLVQFLVWKKENRLVDENFEWNQEHDKPVHTGFIVYKWILAMSVMYIKFGGGVPTR